MPGYLAGAAVPLIAEAGLAGGSLPIATIGYPPTPGLLLLGNPGVVSPPGPAALVGYPPVAGLMMLGYPGVLEPGPPVVTPGGCWPWDWWIGGGGGLAADFEAAVRELLDDDPALRTNLKGGLWWRQAPAERPGDGFPFGVYFVAADSYEDVSTSGDFLRSGILQISIFARDASVARRIADRAARTLTDADVGDRLRWRGGRLMYLRPSNPASRTRPERGPGQGLIWGEVRSFNFQYYSRFYTR